MPDGFSMCKGLIAQTLWHLLLTLTHVAEVHLLHGVTSWGDFQHYMIWH